VASYDLIISRGLEHRGKDAEPAFFVNCGSFPRLTIGDNVDGL
jgi:hypothetical protein